MSSICQFRWKPIMKQQLSSIDTQLFPDTLQKLTSYGSCWGKHILKICLNLSMGLGCGTPTNLRPQNCTSVAVATVVFRYPPKPNQL